jgi:hypothetical protein
MNRRKTVSVTPAMGASTVAGAICTAPIDKCVGKGNMASLNQSYRFTSRKRNCAPGRPAAEQAPAMSF